MTTVASIFERVRKLVAAARLPQVEESTYYGRPALKVAGSAFVSVKDEATIILSLPLDDKEMLLGMAPEIYFQTDHYRGWPALLVRTDAIADDELALRLIQAWRFRAPKKTAAGWTRPS